jgi:hypothetical protein
VGRGATGAAAFGEGAAGGDATGLGRSVLGTGLGTAAPGKIPIGGSVGRRLAIGDGRGNDRGEIATCVELRAASAAGEPVSRQNDTAASSAPMSLLRITPRRYTTLI